VNEGCFTLIIAMNSYVNLIRKCLIIWVSKWGYETSANASCWKWDEAILNDIEWLRL